METLPREEPRGTAARGARRGGSLPRVRLLVLTAAAAVLLGGCTGNVNTPGETLRILGATLPTAYVGEPYNQAVEAVGGLRPYDFKLADGTLPPGLELQGGTIRGTPTKTGSYTFTAQVSDANLSTTVQKYTLTVAQVPPPTLDFNAPNTQVDRPVTLRVRLKDARKLQGLRTQVRWDDASFELVPDSVKASRAGLAVFQRSSPGELQVALAPLGTRIDGQADLFEFQLRPVAGAAYLSLDAQTEYLSVGGHAFNRVGGAAGGGGAGKGGTSSTSAPSGQNGSAP